MLCVYNAIKSVSMLKDTPKSKLTFSTFFTHIKLTGLSGYNGKFVDDNDNGEIWDANFNFLQHKSISKYIVYG